jgi:hypothetical protein
LHLPDSQRAVWHSTTGQSESIEHSAVWTQPRVGSQVLLRGQLAEFGVFEHDPAAHLSSVQATLSLHSVALQQVPHVAEPPVLVQHRFPGQRSTCLHWPDSQTPLWQASCAGHCESLQHCAQPLSGQHTVPLAQ